MSKVWVTFEKLGPSLINNLKIFYFIIQIHHTNMLYHTTIIHELYSKLNNMSTNGIKITEINYLFNKY
jgi:hypothetical protein